MESTFSVRTQQIIGSPNPLRGGLCRILDITPDSSEVFESRGRMFVLLELYDASASCDLTLTMSLIADALQESYFSVLDGTPITALEKAILDVKQKLAALQQSSANPASPLYIGLSVVVVWGKVVYISQLGDNNITLLRKGEQKVIAEKAGGDVNVSSGILEEGDVLICATDNFVKRFPYDFIVKNSSRIEQEVGSFEDSQRLGCLIVSVAAKNILAKSSLVNIITPKRNRPKKISKKTVSAVVAVATAMSLIGVIFSRPISIKKDENNIAQQTESTVSISQVETSQDVIPTPLVDFKRRLAKDINLSSFVVLGKTVSAVVQDSGEGYIVDLESDETDGIKELEISQSKVYGLSYLEGKYYILTEGGVYAGGDLSTMVLQKVNGDLPKDITGFAVYNGNIYILSPAENQIYKLAATADGYAVSSWITGEVAIASAKSIAVDYYAFVLLRDGTVLQLLKGEKTNWSLTNAPATTADAISLFAPSETTYLYLLYSNGEVAQFSKEGVFVKTFKSGKSLEKAEIKSFFVDESNAESPQIYLLNSNQVFKLED